MIESVTIKWVIGSSKLKKTGNPRKRSLAFEKKYAIVSLGNLFFFRNNRMNVEECLHN